VHARVYVHLLWWVWHALNMFLEHQCMDKCVHYTGVFDTSIHGYEPWHSLQGVHTFSCMRSWSISVGGRGCRGSGSPCRALIDGVGRCFWHEKSRDVVSIFSIFGLECMWVYVCVYAHTHTHTARGVLGCEPRGWDETPGEPNKYIFVHVYKVHVWIYLLKARWDLGLTAFFL